MEHPVFLYFEHSWLNRVTKLEYTLIIYCNIESENLEFYNCIWKQRSLKGQWLIRLDKGRCDFINAWRLSAFPLHSKSSENSVDGASLTAACSQVAISHANFCEVLSCMLRWTQTLSAIRVERQLYGRRCSHAHVSARSKDEENPSICRCTRQNFSSVKGFPVECLLLTQLSTFFIQQSPSWEASRLSASQEILRILRNPKIQYRIRQCPQTVPILS